MLKRIFIFSGMCLVFFSNAQTTLVLQPGAGEGCDATLGFHTNYNKDLNYGDQPHIKLFCMPGYSGGNNTCRALLSFDLTKIPAGATITSAKLTLYASGKINDKLPGHYGNNASTISRVTSPWTEFGVKWNTAPSYTSEHAVAIPQSTDPNQDYTLDVLLLVKDLIASGTPQNGFYLALNKENPGSPAALCFNSSDHPDASRHPKLEIVYTVLLKAKKKQEIAADTVKPKEAVAVQPEVQPAPVNPVQDSTSNSGTLVLKTGELANATISIYTSADHKLVKSVGFQGTHSTYSVPIGDLSAGTYTIEIVSDGEKGTMKFVKNE